MSRFFRFLLFVCLLITAVASVQMWTERRAGVSYGLRQSLGDLLHGKPMPRGRPEKYTVAEGPRVDLKDVDVLAAMSRQRIVLARAVVPSVVSITTSRAVQAPTDENDPFSMFHRGLPKGEAMTQRQLGSGAIVSKEGHIVTNNHVIEGMDQIEVELADGRRKSARLIGTDAETDIAVLKIDAGDLLPLPFGDSEQVEVGETVMAVGNPFGLEESVTQGIVSAKGRRGAENTSELFQTDAQINPGNSGGPLINVRGELIGINEAIYSESGSFQGIGFAIPAATVRRTMDGILKTGRVLHGYLGIERALTTGPGVLVDRVVAGSPADKAAIKPGDVIRKFNGKAVNDFDDLKRGVAAVDVDAAVPVEIVRNGKTLAVQAQIAERLPLAAQLSRLPHYPGGQHSAPGGGENGLLPGNTRIFGALLHDITPAQTRTLGLPDGTTGVLVMEVGEGTPAADKLRPGDVIEQVNQEPVDSVNQIGQRLRPLPEKHPVVLSILRERSRTLVVINPG